MTIVRIGASQPGDFRRATANRNTRFGGSTPPIGSLPDGEDVPPIPKMVLSIQNSQKKIILPYAPREVVYSGIGRTWTELNRDGDRTPLLVPSAKRLRKLNFSIVLGRDYTESIRTTISDLESLAEAGRPVIVQWSAHENGFWRVTNFQVTSVYRHPTNNEITRASVDLEFTRASDAKKNLGPAGGGKKGNNGKGDGKDNGKDRPKKYTVKAGDTLQSIGMKFYKNHKAWRKIAQENKIKNPKSDRVLKPGKVLKLP